MIEYAGRWGRPVHKVARDFGYPDKVLLWFIRDQEIQDIRVEAEKYKRAKQAAWEIKPK